ncbi:uncharacterized protein [Miscanthus floridulus]|uniref:uncharacterized protein n=1 Tax=Miscanthus floridulus TaxID=154761 RepID=UPI00345A9ACD
MPKLARLRAYCYEMIQIQGAASAQKALQTIKWTKPHDGVLKLNCDASFKAENMSGSWVFLIRDHDGNVVLTGRGRLNHVLSAFQAELISCLQGVQAAANLGVGKLILETNAQMVQQSMRSDIFDAMPEGALVEELRFLARVNFIDFVCNFQSRVGNRAAHALAALGYECIEGEELITSFVPEIILVIVSDDLSVE